MILLHDPAQAKEIATEHGLQFSPKKFNFSPNWLLGFKKANNINRPPRLQGEGESADLVSVQAVREAKNAIDQVHTFVSENSQIVEQAMSTSTCTAAFMADSLRTAIHRIEMNHRYTLN